MKHAFVLGLCLTASVATAQNAGVTPPPPAAPAAPKIETARDTTGRISARLAADFSRVIAEYTQAIVDLNEQVRLDLISAESAQEKRDSLDLYLSKRLETVESVAGAWAEKTAKSWDSKKFDREIGQSAAADTAEEAASDSDEESGMSLGFKDGKLELNLKRKKWKREFNQTAFYFGTGNWFTLDNTNGPLNTYAGTGALNATFAFNYSILHGYRLFHKQSPFWLRTGMGFQVESFYFDQAVAPYRTTGGFTGDRVGFSTLPLSESGIRENSLGFASLELPLSLVINGSRKGTKGITLAAGGFGGVRLGPATHTLRYRDENRDRHIENTQSSFFMPLLNYGLSAELGYRSVRIAARYNLNPVFRQNGVVDETGGVRSASLGVMWTL